MSSEVYPVEPLFASTEQAALLDSFATVWGVLAPSCLALSKPLYVAVSLRYLEAARPLRQVKNICVIYLTHDVVWDTISS